METRFSLHSSGDRLGTWANNVTHQPSQSWTKTILSTVALGHHSEHKIASPYSLPAASLSFFIDARAWIILASQYVILFSFRNTWSCWFGKGKKKSAVQQEYFVSAVTSLSKSGWFSDWLLGSDTEERASLWSLTLTLRQTHRINSCFLVLPGKFRTSSDSQKPLSCFYFFAVFL